MLVFHPTGSTKEMYVCIERIDQVHAGFDEVVIYDTLLDQIHNRQQQYWLVRRTMPGVGWIAISVLIRAQFGKFLYIRFYQHELPQEKNSRDGVDLLRYSPECLMETMSFKIGFIGKQAIKACFNRCPAADPYSSRPAAALRPRCRVPGPESGRR